MSAEYQIVARDEVPLTHLDGVPYADSRVIAVQLDNEHRNVMEMITNFQDEFEEFGIMRFETEEISGRGRPARYALLNEDQCYLLLTYSRNSEKARAVKRGLVRAFKQAREGVALSPAEQALKAAQALVSLEREVGMLRSQTHQLEHRLDDQPISAHSDKENHIYRLVHELGDALGGAYHVGKSWNRFKAYFNLNSYKSLTVRRYPEAVEVLTKWIAEAKGEHGLFN